MVLPATAEDWTVPACTRGLTPACADLDADKQQATCVVIDADGRPADADRAPRHLVTDRTRSLNRLRDQLRGLPRPGPTTARWWVLTGDQHPAAILVVGAAELEAWRRAHKVRTAAELATRAAPRWWPT